MEPVIISSPDGNAILRVFLKDTDQERGCLFYNITYKDAPILQDSRLGLVLDGAPALLSGFRVLNVSRSSERAWWQPLYGERAAVCDHYHGAVVELEEAEWPHRRLQLECRAYNEGVVIRYTIPQQPGLANLTIASERTEFRFPPGCMAYEEHGTEGEYAKVRVEEIRPECERPLTVEYPDGKVACVAEAAVDDYARMLLSPFKEIGSRVLVSDLSGAVIAATPFSTPWRVFILGDRPGDLLERNDIILSLNPPCAIGDTSWIKPGKAIREVTLSTKGGKACVDFAVAHNLQYVEYDAGWYGYEWGDEADATTVTVDPKRIANMPGHGGLDLHEVIRYANERNIGIVLYVNRGALERQLDEILPLYERWGVKGVKFGFVRVGPQRWTRWLHDAVAKAAEHHLMVDIHDEYRPTGFSRTYPNLLTQEGVRGNEHMPTPGHNATLPFTRFPAGAADVTICYYSERIKPTHAHQLAMAAVVYSPLQFLFWYDGPAAYRDEPEVEFFEHIPTYWDDSRAILGKIGEFATIARRKGREWYVGTLTNEEGRTLKIPLDFLGEGRYVAHVYGDAPLGDTSRTHVTISRHLVDASTVIRASMAPGGGQAMRIVPAAANDVEAFPKYQA